MLQKQTKNLRWLVDLLIIGIFIIPVCNAAKPAFKCKNLKSSIEEMICQDDKLAELDRLMQTEYNNALKKLPKNEINTQKTLQRGWIKGRNDCWKADDKRQCVENEYGTRMTELQIMTGAAVVPAAVVFDCGGDQRISAYFYQTTQIPAAVLNLNLDQVTAFISPSGSGAKYEGQDVSFWNKGDEAMVTWKGQELKCKSIPSANE